jgi:hypothetical protein
MVLLWAGARHAAGFAPPETHPPPPVSSWAGKPAASKSEAQEPAGARPEAVVKRWTGDQESSRASALPFLHDTPHGASAEGIAGYADIGGVNLTYYCATTFGSGFKSVLNGSTAATGDAKDPRARISSRSPVEAACQTAVRPDRPQGEGATTE